MKKDDSAISTALVAGGIYLAIGLLWHLINVYTDGAISYYGSIFFFVMHFLGLIIVKTFYVHDIAEPFYLKHIIAIFMIAVNALAVVLAVFAFEMRRKPNKTHNPDAPKDGARVS